MADKFPPRCVIDDGSHLPEHQIFSFELLFPFVQPGGCYIVEDISSEPSVKHNGISAISYFAAMQRQLMGESPVAAERRISRVDVFPRAIAIWKTPEVNYSIDLPLIEDLVRRSEKVESLLYFSEYLDYRLGFLDRALEIARRGADVAPDNPWLRVRIADVLQKKGDFDGAIAAAREAQRLRPDTRFFEQYLRRLTSRDARG